jgi:abortive infection bacteriophage resistance protein
MAKKNYTKPALDYLQQIQLLESRGLIISNRAKALHLLQNLSYYRLSGYWYPFLEDKKNHKFKEGATFEKAFKIYCFDRGLRLLLLREIEKIEVAIRAKMIYVLSHKYGPFWHLNNNLFKANDKYESIIEKIANEYNRSDERFITEYKKNYTESLPPSWILMEIISFGSLSKLYEQLKPSPEKREISKYFGVSDSVFGSWIHSIVYLRNVCAHHSRLWNRIMRVRPIVPRTAHKPWLNNISGIKNNRTYYQLSIIQYLLNTVNPSSTFKEKLIKLLEEYPNIDPKAMGFPLKWQKCPLWKDDDFFTETVTESKLIL